MHAHSHATHHHLPEGLHLHELMHVLENRALVLLILLALILVLWQAAISMQSEPLPTHRGVSPAVPAPSIQDEPIGDFPIQWLEGPA